MKFSVIICTYKRPKQVFNILESIRLQALLPNEIWIIDGSDDQETEAIVKVASKANESIFYYQVAKNERGLTKQRNVGLEKISYESEIVVFLDDDLILEPQFFEEIINGFKDSSIIGSDGLITNENYWVKLTDPPKNTIRTIYFEGYMLKLGLRDVIRRILGLYPTVLQPGVIPKYGHGKTSLPSTGKSYEVDHIMGCCMAFRKNIFEKVKFSEFFEGYGLYEDFDFSVRASKYGKLVTNTAAKCEHHHAPGGRPNLYKYGKMVVWNGYYVWRLKHPYPGLKPILKWYSITLLLLIFRLFNGISGPSRKGAFLDGIGRGASLLKLLFFKPKAV